MPALDPVPVLFFDDLATSPEPPQTTGTLLGAGPVEAAVPSPTPPQPATFPALPAPLAGLLADVRTRRLLASSLAVLVLLAALVVRMRSAPGSETGAPRPGPAAVTELTPAEHQVARADLPLVDVFPSPDVPEADLTLEHPRPGGTPLVFLVVAEADGWLKVHVPAPPAGRTGWIRRSHVELTPVDVRIVVELDHHRLVVEEAGRVVMQAPISVGAGDAPRPGTTFVTKRAVNEGRTVGYGSHTLLLAGYTNGPDALFRGSGLVAVHGVDDPLVLGQDVTRGSIGLANDDIARLFELAPPGTPVEVVAAQG